ncbi:unnamed protein product, partial [Rotaria sordida]
IEQFGILCSVEDQTRQHIFHIINGNTNTNSHSSKSYFIDSMSSLSLISTLSNSTHHHGNNQIYILYQLVKAIFTLFENSDTDSG